MNLAWYGLDIFILFLAGISQRSKDSSYKLYWQLLKILEIHELLALMLEIIIIVLDTEANTRLLILGLPVFCKFNFIFFEAHSNMLKNKNKQKKTPFFPGKNILLLLKNIFSSIEYWVFFPTYTKKSGQKCIFNNVILWLWKQVMSCVFASLWCLTKS